MLELKVQESKLKNAFCLPEVVAVYVPATTNTNEESDNSEQVRQVLSKLSKLNGGASAINLTGSWLSDDKGLVLEKTVKVFSNCQEVTIELINALYDIAQELKESMNQESVAIEINSKIFLI